MKVMKMIQSAILPQKAHAGDLGYDLFSVQDEMVYPDETRLISTGIAIQFPEGYGAFIKDRSSVATKMKLFTVAGVIDIMLGQMYRRLRLVTRLHNLFSFLLSIFKSKKLMR
jgi:dUTPase